MNVQQLEQSNDLLNELDESIPQGVPNDTGNRRRLSDLMPDEGDPMDSLDALLADSISAVEAEQQYKSDRKAKARGYVGLSKEEVDFCNSRMQAFEMAKDWHADKAIAIFSLYQCACGEEKRVFGRFMEHHKHRRNPTASRWQVVGTPMKSLSVEAVYETRPVPLCTVCAVPQGYDTHSMRNLTEVLK